MGFSPSLVVSNLTLTVLVVKICKFFIFSLWDNFEDFQNRGIQGIQKLVLVKVRGFVQWIDKVCLS